MNMNEFKGRHFEGQIVLWAVRWYCRYPVSYRDLETMMTAYATIKGFEVMRALRKGQARVFAIQGGIVGEKRIVERAFGIRPCALTEVMTLLQNRLDTANA